MSSPIFNYYDLQKIYIYIFNYYDFHESMPLSIHSWISTVGLKIKETKRNCSKRVGFSTCTLCVYNVKDWKVRIGVRNLELSPLIVWKFVAEKDKRFTINKKHRC